MPRPSPPLLAAGAAQPDRLRGAGGAAGPGLAARPAGVRPAVHPGRFSAQRVLAGGGAVGAVAARRTEKAEKAGLSGGGQISSSKIAFCTTMPAGVSRRVRPSHTA